MKLAEGVRAFVRWVLLGTAAAGAPLACSTGGSQASNGSFGSPSLSSPLYDHCLTSADCASGLCARYANPAGGTCAQPCGAGGSCPDGGGCGVTTDGTNACLPACYSDLRDAYACENAVPLACASADATHCDVCPSLCPSSMRCIAGMGCATRANVGEPCRADTDCSSNNCGSISGLCRVPVGQACTGANCDLCLLNDSYSYCSRPCQSETECNGGLCLDRTVDVAPRTCTPPCSSLADHSCPGTCVGIIDQSDPQNGKVYCNYQFGLAPPMRSLGQSCGRGDDCISGQCFTPFLFTGMCTHSCASGGDCAPGFVCAVLPCGATAGDAGTCADCVPACGDGGTCARGSACRMEMLADGTTGAGCDVRSDNGTGCVLDSDCYSNRCTSSLCVPAAGAPVGTLCNVPSDCASNNCAAGRCKGTVLLGGACQSNDDCAVGMCCSAGASQGTCETTC
jgi:hypothetical protein